MTDRGPSEAVRRVLARDDLLMMAVDADEAVGVVREREALSRLATDEKSLFSVALGHYLTVVAGDEAWATKARAWRYAGVIVRFCEMVGIPVEKPDGVTYTSAQMHTNSLRALFDDGRADDPDAEPRDLAQHTYNRWRAARDLRLAGDFDGALGLAQIQPEDLFAGGAEGYLAHLLFEVGASYIAVGQAAQVEGILSEVEGHWQTRAGANPARYRADFIGAVARWDRGNAIQDLACALQRVRSRTGAESVHTTNGDLEVLSVTLAAAEHLAAYASSDDERAAAAALGRCALTIADEVRGRWRVIARSRAPLAVVFQRLHGDIALLADSLPGPDAAELGLRVALSAKQTGFAARIRTGRRLMNPLVERIIDSIVDVEDGPRSGLVGDESDTTLAGLRFELEQAVSPLLADTVLPPPADLTRLIDVIGARYALDFVELTDSLAGPPNLFRSLIRPDGRVSFERFTPDRFHATFFGWAREHRNLARLLNFALAQAEVRERDLVAPDALTAEDERAAGEPGEFDWQRLAESILPEDLRAVLAAVRDRPIDLLISAHSWLCLVPWAALEVTGPGGRRSRLIERAVLTQTPVFTCLQHEQPPPVEGLALIRLVGRDEEGVEVAEERLAWGLPADYRGVRLSQCRIHSGEPPTPHDGGLVEAMGDGGRWGFGHFAAHGDGQGLAQYLKIPGESLSFGRALTLKWPTSVLMASCHVGQVINVVEAEPLNLVMALLSGGARCVVAGITSIDDRGTGEAAHRIVTAIRTGRVSLDVALRDAQLAAVRAGAPEREWALLCSYTQ